MNKKSHDKKFVFKILRGGRFMKLPKNFSSGFFFLTGLYEAEFDADFKYDLHFAVVLGRGQLNGIKGLIIRFMPSSCPLPNTTAKWRPDLNQHQMLHKTGLLTKNVTTKSLSSKP